MAYTLTLTFITLLLLTTGIRIWLGRRHIAHIQIHRSEVPAAFSSNISLEAHQKAADYSNAKTRLVLTEATAQAVLLALLTVGGGLQWIDDIWRSILPSQEIARGALVICSAMIVSSIIDIPFDYYKTFTVDEKFGFNKMTRGMFYSDLIKHSIVGVVLGAPILFAALWLMQGAGAYWWLYLWIVWSVFNLLMLAVYPTFIAPFFNKFSPLTDEALKQRIEALLSKCGFKSQGLFVMDGSARSSHGNAYFTGIGKAKRIVFFDTLIEKLSPAEIEAVLAHELGHFKKKHIRKRLITTFIMSLLGLALLGWVSTQAWFYFDLGVTPERDGNNGGLALALFTLALPVFTFFLTPISSFFSRKHEFEADAFAAEKTNANDLVTALVKLYQDNAATLTPDPTYSAFYDSHPPAPIRIANLKKLASA